MTSAPRLLLALAAIGGASLALWAGASTAHAGTKARPCADAMRHTQLRDNFGKLTVYGTSCAVARKIERAWANSGASPGDCEDHLGPRTREYWCWFVGPARDFTCIWRAVADETAKIRCTAPGRRIVAFRTGA